MDAAPPPVAEEPPARDWSLVPVDVLSSVFVKLSTFDVLTGAGLVCHSWLDAAKAPYVWRVVEMDDNEVVDMDDYELEAKKYSAKLRAMAKAAVDRSDGQLRVFAGKLFVNKELLKYILERSPLLTTLRLASCSTLFSKRVTAVIRESPLLELCSLQLDKVDINVAKLTAVLENCPVLEALTVRDCSGMYEDDKHVIRARFPLIKTLTFQCDDEDDDDIGGCCCGYDY